MKSQPTKPFWQSANFWTAVVLVIGGLFVGFPAEAAENTVLNIFTLIAGSMGIREWLKGKPKLDPEKAVNRSNWWNYLATVVISIFPNLPPEILTQLEEAVGSAIAGNWQGLIVAVFSIATILYNLFQQRKKEEKLKASFSVA